VLYAVRSNATTQHLTAISRWLGRQSVFLEKPRFSVDSCTDPDDSVLIAVAKITAETHSRAKTDLFWAVRESALQGARRFAYNPRLTKNSKIQVDWCSNEQDENPQSHEKAFSLDCDRQGQASCFG
jgi:hypothetical protein